MAKYVEFVGVPGVGKTATYTQLKCSTSSFNYYHNFRKNPYSIKGAVNNKIQSLRKKFHSSPLLSTKPEDLLARFLEENQELADKFWEVVLLDNDPFIKNHQFHIINYIRKIIEKIQLIKEDPSPRHFVVDEGLIHNYRYFLPNDKGESVDQKLTQLFQIMDLPQAIVFFHGDIPEIVDRTLARNKLLEKDMNLSKTDLILSREEEMMDWIKSIQILKEKKVEVLWVESHEDIDHKVQKITRFINALD
jgi:deoxyadenosine/deoxycytidine kinase